MPWMIPTVVKNLLKGPVTRRYPFKDIREPFPACRGKLYFDTERCDFCGDCERVCPSDAIHIDTENKKIKYNPFNCIYCATCVQTCLEGAITQDKYYTSPSGEKAEEMHKLKLPEG